MTYEIKDWLGNLKAEVLTMEEYNRVVNSVNDLFDSVERLSNNLLSIKGELKSLIPKSKIEDLKKLQKELTSLKAKKGKLITEELKAFETEIKKFKTEQANVIKSAKKELADITEENKKELNKKFLEEISKPISDKNRAVKETLQKFYKVIEKGIDDYQERDTFIQKFKEIIAGLSIDIKTKDNLLEMCTNEQVFWEQDNQNFEKEWSNNSLYQSLRGFINKVSSGYDADKIYIMKKGKHSFYFETGEDKIAVSKKTEQQGNKEDIAEEEESQEDLKGGKEYFGD